MHVVENEPLQDLNTLSLEGCARALTRVRSGRELRTALDWAKVEGLAVVPLGEGSNVVIAGDVDALVIRMETRGITVLDDSRAQLQLRVAAGENWHSLVAWTIGRGFYGLENLALIPGTVGAAPIQNIGAYGVELAGFVQRVHCISVDSGEPQVLDAAACRFGYRDSVFKQALRDSLVITEVDFQLSHQPAVQVEYPVLSRWLEERGIVTPTPQSVFEAVVDIRRSKLPDPRQVPNAGSFFKNPVVTGERARALSHRFPDLPQYPQADGSIKLPAAWLIDYCGWKGHCKGGLGVHPQHALVIVNYGSNSGKALLALAADVAASVLDSFDIELEIEPRIYGGAR